MTNYPERVILIMEKRRPHYDLKAIIAQMTSVEAMNLTQVAVDGIRAAGMTKDDALGIICGLTMSCFYKSMTAHKDYKIWQDVYHADWRGKPLYVKFQLAEEYFVVSFKER